MGVRRNLLLKSALAGAFTLASAAAIAEDVPAGKEKCYGVAKKGKNDCGNGAHSCGGHATKDYDEKEWKYVKAGTCKKVQKKVKAMKKNKNKKKKKEES